MNDELVSKGWKQMELLLDERMPVNRKRRYAGYYWLVAGIILLLSFSALYLISNRSDNLSASKSNDAVSSEIEQHSSTENASSTTSNNSTSTNIESNSTVKTHTTATSNAKTKNSSSSNPRANSTLQKKGGTLAQNENSNLSSLSGQPNKEKSSRNKRAIKFSSSPTTRGIDSDEMKHGTHKTIGMSTSALPASPNSTPSLSNQTINTTIQNQTPRQISQQHQKFNSGMDNAKMDNSIFLVDRIDLLSLNLIDYNYASLPKLTSLEIKPRQNITKRQFRWELFIDGMAGKDVKGTNLGINMIHRISNKLSLTTGIELAYYQFNKFNHSEGSTLPTNQIFANAATYSGYLADNSIKSSEFITSVTTIFAPINLHYSIGSKLGVALGIRPGIQVDQSLSYAPVASETTSRNPSIEDGKLNAEDFFYQKSVATVQTSFGINYHVSPRFSVGTFYRQSLSDYGRSVQYASNSRLDQVGAEGVDRRFYSIGTKELSSNLVGLRVGYKF